VRVVCIPGNRLAINDAAFYCCYEGYDASFGGSHNDAFAGLSCLLFHGQAFLIGLLKAEAEGTAIIRNVD